MAKVNHPETKKQFGDVVYSLRKGNNWSRRTLSEQCKISPAQIRRIEKAETDAGLSEQKALAVVFNTTLGKLHGYDIHPDDLKLNKNEIK